ncbi:MAG TPA: hypothetical protein VH482_37545 [Thermomicrobiales bacterium]
MPPPLAAFLRGVDLAAVTTETTLGTVLVVKAPAAAIAGLAGEVPVGIHHELYNRPTAPVVRMVTAFYDVPDDPLVFETFFNVGDLQQRREYALLSRQGALPIVFYDEGLSPRLGKRVRIGNGEEIAGILSTADGLYAAARPELFDFDEAKQEVIERTDLKPFPYHLGGDPF